MNRKILSMTAGAAIGLLLDGTLLCSPAYAQSWLPDRQYMEGPGIKLGDFELHPGIALRGGYDTNVFKADGEEGAGSAGQEIVGSGLFAVTPHVNITTQGKQRATEGESAAAPYSPPKLALRAGLAATYFYYLEDEAPRNLEVDTEVWVGILPERPINVELATTYQRNTRPFTQSTGSVDNNTYAHNAIRPSARVNVGSKSQVLTGFVGYAPNISLFENRTFKYLNAIGHTIDTGSAWKFLPHTALLYDASLNLNDYTDYDANSAFATVLLSDSQTFKTRLGLNGALTNRLSLRVMAGYAAGFFEDALLSEFQDVVGEAVLGYKFLNQHRLEAGYTRDVQLSAIGGWLRSDRAVAALRLGFAGAFSLGFEAAYGYLTYGRLLDADGAPLGTGSATDRNDHRIDGAIRAEYRATNWLAFMADASVQNTITDFNYAVRAPGAGGVVAVFPDPASYLSFQFFGGVRAHY